MTTETENLPRAVLAELTAQAAGQDWTEVTEFGAAIAGPGSRDITVLAAEGTDPARLVDWLLAQAGGDGAGHEAGGDEAGGDEGGAVAAAALEPALAEPGRVLAPNRVVVALRSGQLLMADTAAAAAMVAQRPAGTYLIVVTGAEDIRSPQDLTLVERGLWRVLLGGEGEEWRGQDISARSCLLWSDQDVAETLRDRVARDVGALRDWVTATVTVPQALDRDRAVFALSLALSCAEKRAAAAAAPEAAVSARRLADLLGEVRGLHTRLLGRIDSDAETTQAQVLASLRTLEQDLIRDLTSGRDLPPDHVAQAGRGWRLAAERVIAERYRTAEDQAGQLLDRVDWDLVNKLAPHPTGTRYPRVILLRLRPAAASLPAEDLREIPALTAAATPDGALTWTAQLRSINRPVLVTAGVGAAALAFLGLPLLPVAGAAALGVLSGSLAGARHQADEARKRAQQLAGAAIPGRIADAASAARQAIRDTSAVIRTAVDAEFTALERALEEQAAPAATERDAQAEAGLDKLTDQLAAWREPQGS